MRPVIFFDNLMLSGTVTGSTATTNNPVRMTFDGSINLGYAASEDVSLTLHSGHVLLTLPVPLAPVAFSLPKCSIPSGATFKLQSMTNPATEAGLVTHLSVGPTNSEVTSYLVDFGGGVSGSQFWRVMVSGASGIQPSLLHEIQLVTSSFQLGDPQVGVSRTHVRQFSRSPIPGGQPFVKRDGPKLRQSTYALVAVSGVLLAGDAADQVTDRGGLIGFIDAVEGGGAFTLIDDLGESYWAELLGTELVEDDTAGVSAWRLTFQEIKVD